MATVTTYEQPAGAKPRTFGGIGSQTSNIVDLEGGTTGTIWDIFSIPANSKVISFLIEIVEDAGETCTLNFGVTGGDVDGLAAAADMNQAAGTLIAGAGDDMPLAVENTAVQKISAVVASGTTFAAGKFRCVIVYASASVS